MGVEPANSDGANRLPGLVEHAVFLGSFRELQVRLLGGSLVKAIVPNDGTPLAYEQGTAVTLHLPSDSLRVLEDTTEDGQPEPPADEEPAEEPETPAEPEEETSNGQ